MNNEKLKQQLRDLCIAADGLATAMHLFYANVSSDILDHIIEEAEKENIRQQNIRSFDEYMSKHHTVETLCGPVRLVNQDKVSKEELGEMMNHCGQDATNIVAYGNNLEQLIGARVRLFHAPGHKCDECPYKIKSDGSACEYHKVELISGHFICLVKPQQDIPTTKQESEEGIGDIMAEIKEKVDDFMDYLDSVVNG